jgi:hypothetical protein
MTKHPAVSAAASGQDLACCLDNLQISSRRLRDRDAQTLKGIRTDLIALCYRDALPGDAVPIPVPVEETTRPYPAESFAQEILTLPVSPLKTARVAPPGPVQRRPLWVAGALALILLSSGRLGERRTSRGPSVQANLPPSSEPMEALSALVSAQAPELPFVIVSDEPARNPIASEAPRSPAPMAKAGAAQRDIAGVLAGVLDGKKKRITRHFAVKLQTPPSPAPSDAEGPSPPSDEARSQTPELSSSQNPEGHIQIVD